MREILNRPRPPHDFYTTLCEQHANATIAAVVVHPCVMYPLRKRTLHAIYYMLYVRYSVYDVACSSACILTTTTCTLAIAGRETQGGKGTLEGAADGGGNRNSWPDVATMSAHRTIMYTMHEHYILMGCEVWFS